MFMGIAITAIGIGIVLMVGYVIISNVKNSLPTPQVDNPCLGEPNNISGTECFGEDNTSTEINDSSYTEGVDGAQTTIFAGFALVAVGIIVLSAFGLIQIFQ